MKRIFPDRPILAVGAFIVEKNKLLLVKRKNPPDKGKWSIPGGAVEIGESLIQAIKREVQEECSLTLTDGKIGALIDKIYFTKDNKTIFHYSIIDFIFYGFNGNLHASSDAAAAEFFPINIILKSNSVADSVKNILPILNENSSLPIYKVYREEFCYKKG